MFNNTGLVEAMSIFYGAVSDKDNFNATSMKSIHWFLVILFNGFCDLFSIHACLLLIQAKDIYVLL